MADTKITEMPAGTLSADDLLTFVDDPSGTPANKKIAYSSLESGLSLTSSQISDLATYATEAYVDAAVAGLYDHKGGYDASANSPDLDTSPSGILKGDAYTVSSAGTFFTAAVDAGDVLIADQDSPTLETHWTIVNRNIDESAFLLADGTRASTGIQELLGLNLTDATELTIASGAITVTQSYHTIDTESDAATDDLDTITVAGGEGDVLVIRPESSSRTVVIKHGTGNVQCVGNDDITLDDDHDFALLIRKDASNWMAFTGGGGVTDHGALSGLTDDDHTQYLLAAGTRAGSGIQELLGLNLTDSTELTIASGAITATQGYHTVDTESDAATDDLDTITVAGGEGDVLVIRPESSSRTVVVKHGTGNVQCVGGDDITLDDDYDFALCVRKDASNWMAFSAGTTGGGSSSDCCLVTTAKTANYTAAAGDLVVCDASGGAFTVTFPAAPSADDKIGVYVESGSFTLAVTIQGNGKTLANFGSSKTLQAPGDILIFQYDGTAWVTVSAGVSSTDYIVTITDGTTVTLDQSAGANHAVTLGGNRTLALTNPTVGQSVMLQAIQDPSGSRTLTFPSSIKWPGGTVPTLTTSATQSDWLGFKCIDASTPVYHGFVVGQGYA